MTRPSNLTTPETIDSDRGMNGSWDKSANGTIDSFDTELASSVTETDERVIQGRGGTDGDSMRWWADLVVIPLVAAIVGGLIGGGIGGVIGPSAGSLGSSIGVFFGLVIGLHTGASRGPRVKEAERITELEQKVSEKDQRITGLERRVQELEDE